LLKHLLGNLLLLIRRIAAFAKDADVSVTVDGMEGLKSIYSPCHTTELRRVSKTKAIFAEQEIDVWPGTDFTQLWSRTPSAVGIKLLARRPAGGDGYFMLLSSPPLALRRTRPLS
jgi:hypothetical protein